MSDPHGSVYRVMTAGQPGAVAIVQLAGRGSEDVLRRLTGKEDWPVGQLRLSRLADIDEGLAGRINATTAQLMPHGGLRVVQKLGDWLEQHGVQRLPHPDPTDPTTDAAAPWDARDFYPEARSAIEADVLHAIARAPSPAAVDLLADQPRLWRRWLETGGSVRELSWTEVSWLTVPPSVVVVGPANVGKSTLLNQLTGRRASVVADRPGTTRDWVSTIVELTPPGGDPLRDAVAVRWTDTPGLRQSDDTVEQRAIVLARQVIGEADVLIALRRSGGDWPDTADLPRPPDLWVVNRFGEETVGHFPPRTVPETHRVIDASRPGGVTGLITAVLDRTTMGLGTSGKKSPVTFSPWLAAWVSTERNLASLSGYLDISSDV